LNTKNTTKCEDGNSDPSLRQTQKSAKVKPINPFCFALVEELTTKNYNILFHVIVHVKVKVNMKLE
jgi:hypothetical protein